MSRARLSAEYLEAWLEVLLDMLVNGHEVVVDADAVDHVRALVRIVSASRGQVPSHRITGVSER